MIPSDANELPPVADAIRAQHIGGNLSKSSVRNSFKI